jgi:predicted nucleic acid-binding protein
MLAKKFIDTNLLVYWTEGSNKHRIVDPLLEQGAVISVQVLNELVNVLRKKKQFLIPEIKEIVAGLTRVCEVQSLTLETHRISLDLMARYKISTYDACIIAAALEANCELLYSEDMQHGLAIPSHRKGGTSLSIRNPFL